MKRASIKNLLKKYRNLDGKEYKEKELPFAYNIHLSLGNVAKYDDARKWYKEFYKGKNWFIENNINAYMTLID